ncbi:hypothetical protein SAMN04489761_2310 [Tenacibaculum sp. MAR_2009_124]|uniref:hypothetical protein n=1 Tax=Tenacibaculum sp. MAR_2009_124 TaxID=1250059 RepID=UPI0008950C33|nr:hypothetical protein [Tenacibaculum sp. MAR_2009_124]SEC18146.1 hypothetical protein SAMN04489761_2310 [Tenacibaculum sp. MAR_2009_124]
MTRNLLFFSTLFLLLTSCNKKTIELPSVFLEEIDFVNTIGGSKNEVAKSVVFTNDGGYAILGYVQSNDLDFSSKTNDSFDFFVIKYSQNDVLEWIKTYGGSDDDRGDKIISTSDGGFAVIGYSESSDIDVSENAGDKDFWILKLDSNGNITWKKTLGYLGKDFGTAIIETSDGGFLASGELDVTASGGEGNTSSRPFHAGGDFWAIKLNYSGTVVWSRYYGGTFTETPSGIVETQNGNFIIAGTSDSADVDVLNNKGTYDFWVIKINSTGDLIWNKNFGGSEIDEAKAIVKTSNNNFLILGNSRSNDQDIVQNSGGADLCIVKINDEGDLLMQKNLGGNNFDAGNAIHQMGDGNFLVSGSTRSTFGNIQNKGQNDAWLLKIDSQANILWQKNIGGSNIDFCFDATELLDGTIIGVGESTSNDKDILENKGFSDILIVKLK